MQQESRQQQYLNLHLGNDKEDSNSIISLHTISGLVQNRRRFQGEMSSITVLEVVDDEDSTPQHHSDSNTKSDNNKSIPNSAERLKCVLHTSCMNTVPKQIDDEQPFIPSDVYGHLLSKGSKVELRGYFSQKNISQNDMDNNNSNDNGDDRPIFWVVEARIRRLSWRPNIIRYFLDCLSTTDMGLTFDVGEIKEALDLKATNEALELQKFCREEGETQRQWRAAELSRRLQDGNSRLGAVSQEMQDVLEKYSWLRKRFPLEHLDLDGVHKDDSPPPGAFDGLESLAPISTKGKQDTYLRKCLEGSRWQRAKRPQLQWMTNQIIEVVQSHPLFGQRPLKILDIGGGRGHLANYLASRLGEEVANVHVIDIDSRTVRNGAKEAKQRSLNVQYEVGDATKLFVTAKGDIENNYDVVIALHACGGLTDVALAFATTNKAALVVTPCCFHSNLHLNVPEINDDGSLSQNMVPAFEWLGVSESDLDTIQLAAELQGDRKTSSRAIHIICALRSAAILRHHSSSFDVKIKTFPISFSTRNHCLVGSFSG